MQIALIINKKKKWWEIITDGDIRRGLLNGLNVNSSIKKVLNRKSVTSKYKLSSENAEIILKDLNITYSNFIK